jgi:uncharacterized protein YdhG (YjbR/CyaY superfamily)
LVGPEGKPLVYYGAWKGHTSLYPITGAIRRAHAGVLKEYAASKRTVRFLLARPLPSGLVERLVKARSEKCARKASREPPGA